MITFDGSLYVLWLGSSLNHFYWNQVHFRDISTIPTSIIRPLVLAGIGYTPTIIPKRNNQKKKI
jgi:hypothetical protein